MIFQFFRDTLRTVASQLLFNPEVSMTSHSKATNWEPSAASSSCFQLSPNWNEFWRKVSHKVVITKAESKSCVYRMKYMDVNFTIPVRIMSWKALWVFILEITKEAFEMDRRQQNSFVRRTEETVCNPMLFISAEVTWSHGEEGKKWLESRSCLPMFQRLSSRSSSNVCLIRNCG